MNRIKIRANPEGMGLIAPRIRDGGAPQAAAAAPAGTTGAPPAGPHNHQHVVFGAGQENEGNPTPVCGAPRSWCGGTGKGAFRAVHKRRLCTNGTGEGCPRSGTTRPFAGHLVPLFPGPLPASLLSDAHFAGGLVGSPGHINGTSAGLR